MNILRAPGWLTIGVISALGVGGAAASTSGAIKHTFLGDLQVVSVAKAATALTAAASVVNAANATLQQEEGQLLSWQVTQSQFVPSLTQVIDPDGTVVYQTNQALNAWVLRLSAAPQCGNSVFHALVVFDDDWQTVLNASVMETATEPNASGCPGTPVNQDPPPVVPSETVSPPTVTLPNNVQNPVCNIQSAPNANIALCNPVYLPTIP